MIKRLMDAKIVGEALFVTPPEPQLCVGVTPGALLLEGVAAVLRSRPENLEFALVARPWTKPGSVLSEFFCGPCASTSGLP